MRVERKGKRMGMRLIKRDNEMKKREKMSILKFTCFLFKNLKAIKKIF